MNGARLHIALFLGILLLTAACGEDEYYYPSVKLEFVTIKAGSDGRIETLIPDKGNTMQVSEDRTNSTIAASSLRRVMSNYEVISTDAGEVTAKIYSLQSVVAPEPKKETDPAFNDGLKTDPVDVTSIWVGRDYLNMILNLKVKGGKQHIFGIVEENIIETSSEKVVIFSLFHDANGDMEYYNRRAYISVPLKKYADEDAGKKIRIKFKYHTYNNKGEIFESEKYCQPGFEYIPYEN